MGPQLYEKCTNDEGNAMLSFGTAELAGIHDRRSILIQPYTFNLTDSSTNRPHLRSFPTSGLARRNEAKYIDEHVHYSNNAIILTPAHAHRHALLLFYEVRMLNSTLQPRFGTLRQKWKTIFTQEPTLLSRIKFA